MTGDLMDRFNQIFDKSSVVSTPTPAPIAAEPMTDSQLVDHALSMGFKLPVTEPIVTEMDPPPLPIVPKVVIVMDPPALPIIPKDPGVHITAPDPETAPQTPPVPEDM